MPDVSAEERTHPPRSSALSRARAHFRQSETEMAERLVDFAIGQDPNDVDAWLLRGEISLVREDLDSASEAFDRCVALAPNRAEAWFGQGRCRLVQGESRAAIKALRTACQLAPDKGRHHFQLARGLMAIRAFDRAASRLERAARLLPDNSQVPYHLGMAHEQLGQRDRALQSYRTAVELDPGLDDAHYRLGLGYLSRKNHTQAEQSLSRAVQIRPDHVPYLRDLAVCLMGTRQGERARALAERVLRLAPDDAQAHQVVAWSLELVGKMSAAESHYKRCLEVRPEMVGLYYNLAREGRFDDDQALLGELERQRHDEDKAKLHFALGEIYRRRGDHPRTFEHFDLANRLYYVDYNPENLRALHEGVKRVCTSEFFASRQDFGKPDASPIFVVGLPRSGTSLVEQILCSHPDVEGLGESMGIPDLMVELESYTGRSTPFPLGLDLLDSQAAVRMAETYLGRLPSPNQRTTDKSLSSYLSLGIIAVLFPNARIIHVKRDLMDTLVSCYFTNFGKTRCRFSYDLNHLVNHIREFLEMMDYWQQTLPIPIFEITYEDLARNGDAHVPAMVQFAGLDWNEACLEFHRSERAVHTASSHQVREPLHTRSIGRWRLYERELEGCRDLLAPP